MTKKKIMIDKDLESLIPNYLKNRENEYHMLKSCLAENQLEELQSIAHKLAGNAGSYGFHELSVIGKNIEHACIEKRYDTISPMVEQIMEYLNSIEVEFEEV